MQMKWFSLFVCAAILAACATPYQPMSTLGGYREIQLASNTYRVMFFGNGYTNVEFAGRIVTSQWFASGNRNVCRGHGLSSHSLPS
jgi:hypothetical protein